MFDLQQTAETEGRQSEAKVWKVLIGQVWAGLSGYCYGSPNLKEVGFFFWFPVCSQSPEPSR